MQEFGTSELIINDNGSIFHLQLRPEQIASKIILVGDPARVDVVGTHLTDIECVVEHREFRTITGYYKGKRISVLSTGIGCDNIDIVVNELDALANIDFASRTEKKNLKQLELVRIGTCGAIQEDIPVGTFIASAKSIGFDGLLNFYGGRNNVCDLNFEEAFTKHMAWNPQLCAPYVIDADTELTNRIAQEEMLRGVTIACGGFYGPQGRKLRVPLADTAQNEKLATFRHKEWRITNFEMESSALAGLSKLLGHKATTCCIVLANRFRKEMNIDTEKCIDKLITLVLERI